MRTDELIILLASDARPVRVLASPTVRFVRWTAIAAVAPTILAAAIGLRAEAGALLSSAPLAGEVMLGVVTAAMAGWAAFLSSVPGAPGARAVRAGAVASGGVWLAAVVVRLMAEGAPVGALLAEPAHLACPLRTIAAAAVPGAAAWWLIGRAAPLAPAWSAGLAALAALAAGAVAAQLMCPIDRAAHALIWHLAPVAALAGVAAGAATAGRRR